MITIKYTFKEVGFTPYPDELERRLATITSDGDIVVSHYAGKKLISKKSTHVEPKNVEKLITAMKKYENPSVYMDAVDSAKIIFDDIRTITFNPAPECLANFIDKFCNESDL